MLTHLIPGGLMTVLISFDQDWAPDYMMAPIIDDLIRRNLKSTWFVTNDSPAVQRMIDMPYLFEVGIHPNFLPDSTQGRDMYEIMNNLLSIVPNAKCVRTHRAYQHHTLLAIIADYGLEVDSSIYLGEMQHIRPFDVWYDDIHHLTRIPYFWSEESELHKPRPFLNPDWGGCGLKVLAFHPVHVFLNSCTFRGYRVLRRNGLNRTDELGARECIESGFGTRRFYEHALEIAANKTLLEIALEKKDS